MILTILNKKKHWRYFTLFMLGATSIIWEISIYRQTLISLFIPIIIILTTGTLAFSIDKENYASTYKIKYINGWAWIQNTMSWGFLACTMFMTCNKYFADENIMTSTHQILDMGTMVGKPRNKANERPLIRIDYYGKTRELVFSKDQLSQMESAKSVTIETCNGLFGYKIIHKQMINE